MSFAYTFKKITHQGPLVIHLGHLTPGLCLQGKQCPNALSAFKGNSILDTRKGKTVGEKGLLLPTSDSDSGLHHGAGPCQGLSPSVSAGSHSPHRDPRQELSVPFSSPGTLSDTNPKILPNPSKYISLKWMCVVIYLSLRMGVAALLEVG